MDNKTPPGLKLITAFYVFAVIFSIYMSFYGTEEEKYISYISIPITIFISIGLFNQQSIARKGVLILSWLAVAGSSLTILFILWAVYVRNLVEVTTTQVMHSLLVDVIPILVNIAIILYLNKPKIRELFNEYS